MKRFPLLALAALCILVLTGGRVLARQGDEVTLSVKALKTEVLPGAQVPIAVIFEHEPGWHIHPNAPVLTAGMIKEKFEPIPTSIQPAQNASVKFYPTIWPKAHEVKVKLTSQEELYGVFDGRAIAYVPVEIAAGLVPGTTVQVTLAITYQACNEKGCQLPVDTEQSVTFTVVDAAKVTAGSKPDPDFKDFDTAAFNAKPGTGQAVRAAAKPVKFSAFGIVFEIDPAGFGLVLLLLVAALGGLLLNFTPCVLPVIPIKIMSLSQAAGNPAKCFFLGTMTSLGVVAFWMAIGGAIATISGFTAISTLFQTPWFSLAVGAFILVMGVGMLGAFAVRLPQFVYMINPGHESAGGAFIFGIMTAVLSTPCTAPFMGSAAAWAATQHSSITLVTFGAIGFGMALPYLMLSAFPALLGRMPRTGPASELIKQVMGLLMVAVAIFFLGTGIDPLVRLPVDPPVRFFWWIIAAVAVGAMAWLVVRTIQITKRPVARVFWTVFAAFFSVSTIFIVRSVTDRGPIPWIGYTPERLAEPIAKGKVVVLDFTAEWCLTCKGLEGAVLHRDEIVKLLTGPGVVPMRVDLSGNNGPGKAKLKELGWVGIPLLVIYGPGLKEPVMYDAYTVDMVKDAIARAAGGAAGSAAIVPTSNSAH